MITVDITRQDIEQARLEQQRKPGRYCCPTFQALKRQGYPVLAVLGPMTEMAGKLGPKAPRHTKALLEQIDSWDTTRTFQPGTYFLLEEGEF